MAWLRKLNFCTSPKADSTGDEMLLWKRKKSLNKVEDEVPIVLGVPSPSPMTKKKSKLIDERIAAAKRARKTSEESMSAMKRNTDRTYKTSNFKIDEQIETLRREVASLILQNVSVIDQCMEAEATVKQLQLVCKLNQGPLRPQTFAADEFFFVRSAKYRKEAHRVPSQDTDFTRVSCHEPLANFILQKEKTDEKKERQKSIRTRFLSNSLRSYILSDSSLNIDNELIQRTEDPLIEETEIFEKDPENDSGHEDDSVFLLENPDISIDKTEIPEYASGIGVSSQVNVRTSNTKDEKRKSSSRYSKQRVSFSDMVQIHDNGKNNVEENTELVQKEKSQQIKIEEIIKDEHTISSNEIDTTIDENDEIRNNIAPLNNYSSKEENLNSRVNSEFSLVDTLSRDTVTAIPMDEPDPLIKDVDCTTQESAEKVNNANNSLVDLESHEMAAPKSLDESHTRDTKSITSLANNPINKLIFTSSLAIHRTSSVEEISNSGSKLRTNSLRSLESSSPKVERPVLSGNDPKQEEHLSISSKYSERNKPFTTGKIKTRVDQLISDSPKQPRQSVLEMDKKFEQKQNIIRGSLEQSGTCSNVNSMNENTLEEKGTLEQSKNEIPLDPGHYMDIKDGNVLTDQIKEEKIASDSIVTKSPPPVAKKPVNKTELPSRSPKTEDKKVNKSKVIPRPRLSNNKINISSAPHRSENIIFQQAAKENKVFEDKTSSIKNRTTGERTLGVRKRGTPSSTITLRTESLMRAANMN